MSTIINNYRDTGFGSPVVDFSSMIDGLENPFSNIIDQEQYNLGFSSSNNEINTDYSHLYKNIFSSNFGSNTKTVVISKVTKQYQYEEIFERGFKSIEANNYIDIKIKNIMIVDPIFICTPVVQNIATDISLNTEKVNTKLFRVYNDSSNIVNVDYIAIQNNTIIKNISIDSDKIQLINNIIDRTLA